MFNIEVIKIIQRKKQAELDEIMKQPDDINVSDDVKDNLTKEINYLNLVIIRYEIAKLLGLENNPSYISVNFLGVENEDVNDYNLTPEQFDEYNILAGQIEPGQIQSYFIRKEMAEVVGEEIGSQFKDKDYEGIEDINPTLIRYNLTREQIRKFSDLVYKLSKVDGDFTTRVDINEEAKKSATEIFNHLNSDSSAKNYSKIKKSYFDTLDALLGSIDENTKNTLFLNVSNNELAYDLVKRYPEIAVKMNIDGVKKMIDAMDAELSIMTPEEYDKCLEILCSSINELYREDSNKNTILGLVNGIKRDNYTLRSDLASNLTNIENAKLDIQDDEYLSFIDLLDQDYDELGNMDRQKYYSLLKRRIDMANDGDVPSLLEFLNKDFDKLSDQDKDNYYSLLKTIVTKDINELDKTEDLNELLVQITNKDLSQRLQKDFANNQNIKFSNIHLNSYDSLVQDTVRKLEKKKSEYQKKRDNARGSIFGAFYDTRIRDIEKEIERVKKVDVNYESSSSLKMLDASYNDRTAKVVALSKEIEELKGVQTQLKSNFQKKRIDKKIAKRTEKIKKLEQSKIKIVGKQKKIMLPKLALERRKGRFNDHIESKAEVFKDYASEYKILADTERKMGGYPGKIKALFYDLKSNRYERKATFNQNMCDVLRAGSVKINGRNRYMVASNKLKRRYNTDDDEYNMAR